MIEAAISKFKDNFLLNGWPKKPPQNPRNGWGTRAPGNDGVGDNDGIRSTAVRGSMDKPDATYAVDPGTK